MNIKNPKPARLVINSNARGDTPFVQLMYGNKKDPLPLIAIKNVHLDGNNFLLCVNDDERVISFKSRRHKKGLDRETKKFSVLALLYDFRFEIKDGKILRRKNLKPEYISLNNIASNSKSKTLEAAYRIVKRLNDCFKENGVPMKIEKKNNLCRLVVQKN